jgi:hypothetical protein
LDGGEMTTDCKECGGSGWVNASGAKTVATVEADQFADPCPKCVPRVGGVVTVPITAAKAALDRESRAVTTVAYPPEALALLGRTVATLEQTAAEAAKDKPTAEEIAAWQAEKDAAVQHRAAHKAHMDRAEARALESIEIDKRTAAALEKIASVLAGWR